MHAVWRATGEAPPELQVPELPAGCTGLWSTYISLHNQRGGGPHGPNPLQPTQIQAWAQLQGVCFTPWEIDTLAALDKAALDALRPVQTAPQSTS